jgi:hypothetical protein
MTTSWWSRAQSKPASWVISLNGFMILPLVARTAALSKVILIPGASQALVLSDIVTAAAEGAGKLCEVFVRPGANDRDPLRAMRPATFLPGRKSFVAAELFTVGCGELPRDLLAAG